jgi:MFS family permease
LRCRRCVAGVGSALAYSPTIVTVGQYFARRRALANGISVAGSGLGNFAVPPLIRAALDRYGFAGALLIMAGLMLHVCLAGALLRPQSSYGPPKRKQAADPGVNGDATRQPLATNETPAVADRKEVGTISGVVFWTTDDI